MNDARTLTIAGRFRGPPSSGNGGYVCGRVAAFLGSTAKVRLSKPPPLDRPMRVEVEGAEARIKDGDDLVATAVAAAVDITPPPPPSLECAVAASARYVGHQGHPFASCFVCGPARAPGDGLRIFAGPDGVRGVAAPFEPSADLFDDDHLRPEFVWAALDCPGYFAVTGAEMVPMLLGELTVELRAPVPRGPLVVYAWSLGSEGRKASCGSALATTSGQVLAVGRGTWIRLRSEGP